MCNDRGDAVSHTMPDRPRPPWPADGDASAAAVDDSALIRDEYASLWRLALDLQACGTVAEAEALAARALAGERGQRPVFDRAITETAERGLETVREREQLRSLAIRDPLTGLYNRRFMEEELARQLSHVRREGRPLAVAMLDLDHFRDCNDRHGHRAGDLVLRSLAVLLQGFRQGSDIPCRYGGEEFVLIMPGATGAEAANRLEPLRRRLAETGVHHEGRLLQPLTASIGVAEFPFDGEDVEALLDSADQAMYRAKRGGRNRICVPADGRA